MFIYLLLISVAQVMGMAITRRLGAHVCQAQAFILAQGALTKLRGKTFTDLPSIVYLDARDDASGQGARLIEKMPLCLRDNAIPVKVNGTRLALNNAIEWIDHVCVDECVVYSAFDIGSGHRFKILN
jgi:hypothetical protein